MGINDVRCEECIYWHEEMEGVLRINQGVCSHSEVKRILGNPITFKTNYCDMGIKKESK